jgi:Ala-tRNA(Pro) deacylase
METEIQPKNEITKKSNWREIMNIPPALLDCLKRNQIDYEILPHAKAFTARMAAAAEDVARHHQAKVVMVSSKGDPVMTVLPADRKLDLRKLERITHERAALQSEREFASYFPDCAVGAMPPFGNLYGLPTYVDQHLAEEDYIVFEAGTYTEAIKLSYRDYERAVRPQVADLTVG